jgi:hypothetical protein
MKALRGRLGAALRSAMETHLSLLDTLTQAPAEEDPVLEGKVAYDRRARPGDDLPGPGRAAAPEGVASVACTALPAGSEARGDACASRGGASRGGPCQRGHRRARCSRPRHRRGRCTRPGGAGASG